MRILVIILFTVSCIISQTVTERFIVKTPVHARKLHGWYDYHINMFADFIYDPPTGNYAYLVYDWSGNKSSIVTPKGINGNYHDFSIYKTEFDKDGNIYILAQIKEGWDTKEEILLKNTTELCRFPRINEFYLKDSLIYALAVENGKTMLVIINSETKSVRTAREFEIAWFVYSYNRDKEPLIWAREKGKWFIETGGKIMKYYDDIYSVKYDGPGNIIIAGNDSDYVVVVNDKEYRVFNWLYLPVLLDKNNIPLFVAEGRNDNLKRLFLGNEMIGSAGYIDIYDVQFTHAGKIAFVGKRKQDKTGKYCSIVINGKEIKTAEKIHMLSFTSNDEPLYIETKNRSEHIVKGDSVISKDEICIRDYRYSAGKLFYITARSADKYERECYYHIDGETIGPYFTRNYRMNDFLCQGISFTGFWQKEYNRPDIFDVDSLGNCIFITNGSSPFFFMQPDYKSQYCCYNGLKNGPFDDVFDIALYKGKPIFIGSRGKESFKMRLYIGMKPVTPIYDAILDYNFNSVNGLITFLAEKNGAFYYVEVKL